MTGPPRGPCFLFFSSCSCCFFKVLPPKLVWEVVSIFAVGTAQNQVICQRSCSGPSGDWAEQDLHFSSEELLHVDGKPREWGEDYLQGKGMKV